MSKTYDDLNRRIRGMIPLAEGVEADLQEKVELVYLEILGNKDRLNPEEFQEMHERANRLYLYVNKLNFARAIAMPPKKPYCEKKPSEGIGEKLKTKDWIYVVKRVFKRKEHNFELDEDEDFLLGKGGSGELRRAKGLFTFLDLELENLTLSPVHYFRIPDLELVDDKNRNFKTIEERDPLGNPVRFNPNVPQDLRMMWDMPLDSEGLLLEVPSGSRFEGSAEKLYIDLGNCDGKG